MLLRLILLTVLTSVICCRQYNFTEYEIIGNVTNIPAKKVYLSKANNILEFLDSADYKDGKFKFKLNPWKLNEGFLASISILNDKNKVVPLFVINYKTTTTADTFSNSGFFVETPTTILTGDFNERYHRVNIKPGPENDLLFDSSYSSFGYIRGTNREASLDSVKAQISRRSDSYFLLSCIYDARHHYTKPEIDSILKLFDMQVQESRTAFAIKFYRDSLLIGTNIPSIKVLNEKFQHEELLDSSSKLTMLIFWASWCGPCRIEIPHIKEIYKKYNSQGLDMVSLSTDKNSKEWLKAVGQENMMWRQCLIDSADRAKLSDQFGMYAIPLIIFIDRNHKEVKRFVGYYENNVAEYCKVIDKNLY